MPISEDEYDLRQGHEAQTTMSKAELRKVFYFFSNNK